MFQISFCKNATSLTFGFRNPTDEKEQLGDSFDDQQNLQEERELPAWLHIKKKIKIEIRINESKLTVMIQSQYSNHQDVYELYQE